MRTVLLFVVLVLIGTACFDAAGRLLLKGETRFQLVKSTTSDSSVLFVYLPGILADGVTSSTGLVPIWSKYGDVLLVSYDGKRFEGDQIRHDVADMVTSGVNSKGYKTIVFIGSSMGGLLSYDTALELESRSADPIDLRFIFVDAPTGRKDLQSPLDKISLGSFAWWAGPISNPLSSLYFKLTFVRPKEKNIEEGLDRDALDQYVRSQMGYPLSWAMDQTRYIIRHDNVKADSLLGRRVVYIRSLRDTDTVREGAYDTWNSAADEQAEYIEVDSTHAGYAERPTTWSYGVERAIFLALKN